MGQHVRDFRDEREGCTVGAVSASLGSLCDNDVRVGLERSTHMAEVLALAHKNCTSGLDIRSECQRVAE